MKGIIADNADTFVPGPGDLQTKADLQKRLMAVQERRARFKEWVAQGKSLDEVKAGLGEPTTPPASAPEAPQFSELHGSSLEAAVEDLMF